jgi:hypothetical protein
VSGNGSSTAGSSGLVRSQCCRSHGNNNRPASRKTQRERVIDAQRADSGESGRESEMMSPSIPI